ncbi:Ger(x)C family spore germination protein [Paenibacillus marchantiophytorum]|uniref:Ger(x)C family spore germination protein n=1 Tax=Paenibacillus marchantiophytorum TaxID=1619310 RepID=UPI001E3276A0|nr:Ger(x)C family spore germination protein [Paenibacillus marchantiophytorum]
MELNDVAFAVGTGVDLSKDGNILITAQFKLPKRSAAGEMGQNYFTATSSGKDILDVMRNMQAQISRRILRGQRQILFIGEDLAKKGVTEILDGFTRDPGSKLRIDIMIVKGTAEELLKQKYPLEPLPVIAALKEHLAVGLEGETALRDFLISASTDGSSPTLEVIETIKAHSPNYIETNNVKSGFRITGSAIFNKELKLVGFLNPDESGILNWIKQNMKRQIITIAKSEFGSFSYSGTHMKSKIRPERVGDRIKIHLTLEGKGSIMETASPFDLLQSKNLNLLEDTLNKETEKQVLNTINKVQTRYKTDIFGFGEAIHKKYPQAWRDLKSDWERDFATAEVDVKVKLNVEQVGTTGPSLYLKKSEIKK